MAHAAGGVECTPSTHGNQGNRAQWIEIFAHPLMLAATTYLVMFQDTAHNWTMRSINNAKDYNADREADDLSNPASLWLDISPVVSPDFHTIGCSPICT